jgi:hypothetical protein
MASISWIDDAEEAEDEVNMELEVNGGLRKKMKVRIPMKIPLRFFLRKIGIKRKKD